MYVQSTRCAAQKRAYVIDNSSWIGHVEVKGIITVTCDIIYCLSLRSSQENKAWDLDFCGGNLFWKANPGARESETRKEERQNQVCIIELVTSVGSWSLTLLVSSEQLNRTIHPKVFALSIKYHSTKRPGRWEKWCLQHKWVKACSDLLIVAEATTGNRTKESLMGPKSRTGFQQGSLQNRFGPLCQDGYFHKEVSVKGPSFICSYFGKPSHFPRHFITKN